MANKWKNFQTAMKEKRSGKRKQPDILSKEEIIIQRLSAEVSGKAQKYSRVGAREFVPYEYDELTIDNIKFACKNHFGPLVGSHTMTCDVLAGEQGPSCSSIDHIPDLKVVHVRFIEDNTSSVVSVKHVERPKKQQRKVVAPLSLPATKAQSPSKEFPKSLSVLEMLKLGKVISEKTSENIELSSFELCKMAWCTPVITEFSIAKKPAGKGGFREAFTATSDSQGFQAKTWVVKKYLEDAIKMIKETNQTIEQHTKKVVQMHMLARNFALKLTDKLKKDDSIEDYGDTLSYKKIYLGKIKYEDREPEWVTVEEFIDGKFSKYINNDGVSCGTDSIIRRKCESLAHFSYEHSNGQLMVVDMQGSNHELFDPEIASRELLDDGEVLFSTGNLSTAAINNFVDQHQSCNLYCTFLGLKSLHVPSN